MSVYRFKLIKAVKGQNTQIKWAEENPDGSWDNHSLTSEDPPRPELYEALAGLADVMVGTHRLQRDDEHEVAVLGLHYKRDSDGYLTGVVLEAQVQLTENTWWKVRSVSLGVREKEEGGILNAIEHEAGLYINGSRAQLQLEFSRSAVEAVRDLKDELEHSGSSMTITHGDQSVTLGRQPEEVMTP